MPEQPLLQEGADAQDVASEDRECHDQEGERDGCGAFKNDINVVSDTFYSLLKNYNFEVVEFALSDPAYVTNSPFNKCNG